MSPSPDSPDQTTATPQISTSEYDKRRDALILAAIMLSGSDYRRGQDPYKLLQEAADRTLKVLEGEYRTNPEETWDAPR